MTANVRDTGSFRLYEQGSSYPPFLHMLNETRTCLWNNPDILATVARPCCTGPLPSLAMGCGH